MPLRPLPLLLAACALAAPVAACGSDASDGRDQDAVQQTVERFVSAFAGGHDAEACRLLSDDAKDALGAPSSCPAGIAALRAMLPTAQRDRLGDAQVESVEVAGDRATVRLSAFIDSDGRPTRLRRVDGRWLIQPEG
ncbi:MAG: hypothetical protein HZB46_05360 [Solirubrobacterales bacterium]|nr:hypothetical protein [Solirubrobacterales bacterium]